MVMQIEKLLEMQLLLLLLRRYQKMVIQMGYYQALLLLEPKELLASRSLEMQRLLLLTFLHLQIN